MESRNEAKYSQESGIRAALNFLRRTNESRDELRRARDNAVRAGQPDLALQYSQDLRQCHGDYLWIGLKLVSIRRSRIRNRAQYQGPGSARYQFLATLLGPEAGKKAFKKWQKANGEAEALGLADEDPDGPDGAVRDPFTPENLTPEAIRKEYLARMEDEKTFLEKLKRVAQQAGNWTLVRACRKELRLLQKDLLEGELEIINFEKDNPSPVDPRPKEPELWEVRLRVISRIRESAIAQGILSEDGRTFLVPEPGRNPEHP